MQTALKFTEDNFDNILHGKRYTIRKGVCHVTLGTIPLIAKDSTRIIEAEIFHISLQPLESLPIDYSKDSLLKIYPDLQDTDEVTLIKFKI